MVKLIFPCKYIGLTQGFKSSHRAIDMGWSKSNQGPDHEIISPYKGKVIYVRNNYKTNDSTGSSYGNYVKIDHGDNVVTLFAHLKYGSVKVSTGDTVEEGAVIGIMGNTGHSTGTHLHYEVILNNTRVNPLEYTYVKSNQTVSDNTRKNYKLLYLKEEEKEVNNEEIKNENILFEYEVLKTGIYKIALNKDEKLVIKD